MLEKKTGYIPTKDLIAFLGAANVPPEASDIRLAVGMSRTMVTWSEPRAIVRPAPEAPKPVVAEKPPKKPKPKTAKPAEKPVDTATAPE